jgi:hypothetical protein
LTDESYVIDGWRTGWPIRFADFLSKQETENLSRVDLLFSIVKSSECSVLKDKDGEISPHTSVDYGVVKHLPRRYTLPNGQDAARECKRYRARRHDSIRNEAFRRT